MEADESLTSYEASRAHIKAAVQRAIDELRIQRQSRRRGIDQYRPRIAAAALKWIDVAELVAYTHAVYRIVLTEKELREKPFIAWVGDQFGIRRTQVYECLNSIEPEKWKEICESAEAFAKRWAESRRRAAFAALVHQVESVLPPEPVREAPPQFAGRVRRSHSANRR